MCVPRGANRTELRAQGLWEGGCGATPKAAGGARVGDAQPGLPLFCFSTRAQRELCALAGDRCWPPVLRSPPVLPAAARHRSGPFLNRRKALPHPLTGSQGSKHRRSPLRPSLPLLFPSLQQLPGSGGGAETPPAVGAQPGPAPPQPWNLLPRRAAPVQEAGCSAHTRVCLCTHGLYGSPWRGTRRALGGSGHCPAPSGLLPVPKLGPATQAPRGHGQQRGR